MESSRACWDSPCQTAEMWALDVNERALRLTAENAARLGIAGRVHAVTARRFPRMCCFDEIWSNPPIHIGKPALHELLDAPGSRG